MATANKPSQTGIGADAETVAETYARWLADEIGAAKPPFRMALCGGTTPRPLYRLLGSAEYRNRIDWPKLRIFWGDERFVPHDNADSNVQQARTLWLDHVPLKPEQIVPMPTDGNLNDCARRYEAELKAEYGGGGLDRAKPLFDVILLGIGTDGHTASLLPAQPVLNEKKHWVAGVERGAPQLRLTLTYPAIASSRNVTFLVTGKEKASIVRAVRAGDARFPAARISSNGELIWFLDAAAASALVPQAHEDT